MLDLFVPSLNIVKNGHILNSATNVCKRRLPLSFSWTVWLFTSLTTIKKSSENVELTVPKRICTNPFSGDREQIQISLLLSCCTNKVYGIERGQTRIVKLCSESNAWISRIRCLFQNACREARVYK